MKKIIILISAILIAACQNVSPPDNNNNTSSTKILYSIGGTLSGLTTGSITLQNNGTDNLTLTADGNFVFATKLASGKTYQVTILSQPSGFTCAVTNGTGTIQDANITNIVVNCSVSYVTGAFTADTVVEAPGNTGSGTGDANNAVNGVRGAGCTSGSFDVFSLNYSSGNYITLKWSGKKVVNGPGIDFIVFENPFDTGSCGSGSTFMDLVIVEVSQDGTNWCGFNPDYTNTDENTYSSDRTKWQRFAGRTPVLLNVDTNPLTAEQIFQDSDNNFEPDLAGGDGFDLDNLSPVSNSAGGSGCNATLVSNIQANGFTYIRLTTAPSRVNPDTGSNFVRDGISNGADIDGVIAHYVQSL